MTLPARDRAVDAAEDLGWDQLLDHLARCAHTNQGMALARELELFDDVDDARRRIAEIAEARDLLDTAEPIPFGGVTDIRVPLGRAAKGGVLDGQELVDVASTAAGGDRAHKHIVERAARVPLLAEVVADMADLGHVYHPIQDSFDKDARLVDHASDALGGLRRRVNQLRAQLDTRAQGFVDNSRNADVLQDKYFTVRDERYVVPVKVESRSSVNGIVHGTSQSGQTVFVEPQVLVELNNKLKLAECAVADEERRILLQLTGYVAEEAPALRRLGDVMLHLDLVAAGARLADKLDATPPVISADGSLDVRTVRHPLMVLTKGECVPNDVIMAPRSVLVISGPNAGGKTVALKSVGILGMLVRAGLHIPAAADSRVPWYEQIHTDIGDAQSLENDLSTFSARLTKLKRFLEEADDKTLLLLDEVAVGTEPEQGAALAVAVLESFADKGVSTIATTHYERLKGLAASDDRFQNASVGFDLAAMAPTFKLHLGMPGSSGALYVARALKLPTDVVDRAEVLLGDRRATVEELLVNVTEERRKLAEEYELAKVAADEARRAKRKADEALASARERESKAHKAEHNEAVATLREVRAELDKLKSTVRRKVRAGDLPGSKQRVNSLAKQIMENAPAAPPPPGTPATVAQLTLGASVFVPSVGGYGEVAGAPERGKISVMLGSIKTVVAIEELRIASKRETKRAAPAAKQTKRKDRGRGRAIPAQASDAPESIQRVEAGPSATLDLRGERVDSALDRVDRFLDESLVQVRDVICIIHGHGTGALRDAVRSHVKLHPSVTDWRAGGPKEGGNGVTLIALDVR